MSKHGKTGTSSSTEKAPWRKARDAKAHKRQEERWARKAGAVTTRFVRPVCVAHTPVLTIRPRSGA